MTNFFKAYQKNKSISLKTEKDLKIIFKQNPQMITICYYFLQDHCEFYVKMSKITVCSLAHKLPKFEIIQKSTLSHKELKIRQLQKEIANNDYFSVTDFTKYK